MIRVNLLPEEYRKPEKAPPSMLLLIVVCIAALCVALYFCVSFSLKTGKLQRDLESKKAERDRLAEDAKEADRLEAQIASYEKRLNTIKGIRASRIYWSRKLYLLAKDRPENIRFASVKMQQKDPYPATKPEAVPPELVKEFDKDKDGKLSADEVKAAGDELPRKLLKDKNGGSLELECYQKSYDFKTYYADYRSRLQKDRIFYSDFASPGLPEFKALYWKEAEEEKDGYVLWLRMVLDLKPQSEPQQ